MNISDIKKWGLARLSSAQKSHAGVATVNSSGQVCGPSGSPVSDAWVSLPPPSGDASGVIDTAARDVAIAAAVAGNRRLHIPIDPSGVPYYWHTEMQMQSGLHVTFAPGATVALADAVTLSCTITGGSAVVSVPSTTLLRAGMFVWDTAGSIDNGTPYGDLPAEVRIQSVGTNTITLTGNATASGTRSLRFFNRTNLIRVSGCTDWSITCPGGNWGILDGRMDSHQYPFVASQIDYVGNGIRIDGTCSNYTIDGICARNNRYHGLIAVDTQTDFRVIRWRGESNGFRGIHYHGDPTDKLHRGHFGLLESVGDGRLAFKTQGVQLNTGVFVVFQGSTGVTIDTIRVRDSYGIGCEIHGRQDGASRFSDGIQIGKIEVETAAQGVAFSYGVRRVAIGTMNLRGRWKAISGGATLAAASTNIYLTRSTDGAVQTWKAKAVQVPAGTISAEGIRPGYAVALSAGATGAANVPLVVWKAEAGAGAGGTDLLWIYNQGTPTSDPYTTAATGLSVQLWTNRDAAIRFNSATGVVNDGIYVGAAYVEGWAERAVGCDYLASEYLHRNVSFGVLDVSILGSLTGFDSMSDFKIDLFRADATGSLFQASGTLSGDRLRFRNCGRGYIGAFHTRHTAAYTYTGKELVFDANCRAIEANINSARLSAATATVDAATPSGAAAPWAGAAAGPIVINNPRASDGTALTVAGSRVVRTDATALIVTRPADA